MKQEFIRLGGADYLPPTSESIRLEQAENSVIMTSVTLDNTPEGNGTWDDEE